MSETNERLQNAVTKAPTRAVTKTLRDCKTLEEVFASGDFLQRIKDSSPKGIVTPERMLKTFIHAAMAPKKDERSITIRDCSMSSVVGTMLSCSELGLEPNTVLGHAYIIPFKRNKKVNGRWTPSYEAQLIIGYKGLLALSYRTRMMTSIHADVVYAPDAGDPKHFDYSYGSKMFLFHRPSGRDEQGEHPACAYAHAALKDGEAFEVMPWSKIERIRNGSQGYQAAMRAYEEAIKKGDNPSKAYTEAPWIKYEPDMAKKTPIRALSKMLPQAIESIEVATALARAVALDEQQDRSMVDFTPIFEGSSLADTDLPEIEHEQTFSTGADALNAAAKEKVAVGEQQQSGDIEQQLRATATQQQAKPKPTEQVKQQPAQETQAEPFEAILCDEWDGADVERPFRNPVAFAEAFADVLSKSENREALIENNMDCLNSARDWSPEAAAIIDAAISSQKPAAARTAADWHVTPPQRGDKPDGNAYAKLMGDMSKGITSPLDLMEFIAANLEIGRSFTTPVRLKIDKMVLEACERLGIQHPGVEFRFAAAAKPKPEPEPETAEQAEAPGADEEGELDNAEGGEPAEREQAEPSADPDEARALSFVADIRQCKTGQQITDLLNGAYKTVLNRWKADKPHLYQRIGEAVTAHRQEIKLAGGE